MSTIKRLLTLLIGWPVSLIALFFIGKIFFTNQHRIASLSQFNPWLLVTSVICFLLYFFLRSYFWQQLLKAKQQSFSYKETASIWGVSELARYIPGNIWSFISRGTAYAKRGQEKKSIAASMGQEIIFLIMACLLISLFSVNFITFGFVAPFPFQQVVPLLLSLFGVGCVSLILFALHTTRYSRLPFFKHLTLPFSVSLQLLGSMTSAFFFFGLGTYFSISSMTPLYLPHIIPLSSFFVLSYLLGYLSFITPMGLGVREAIMTAGLAKYIPLHLAAFGSLLSRIVLIVSELLFIGICLLWTRFSIAWMRKGEAFFLIKKYEITLFLSTLLYTVYFTIASFLRYANFYTGRFDLGNMDQTVWNTIHGRIFQLTNPDGTNIISRLSFHADFILALLAPFYLIWQDPRTLLLIQTIFLASGAFFVYAISQKSIANKPISLAFALSYLIYPAINHANLYDFHAVTLAVPLFLAGWYCMMRNNFIVMSILFLLAGLTKEEVWIIVGLLGLWSVFVKKKYVLGSLLSGISFFLFYYLFWHAIPQAHGGSHFALSYYADFGSTPTGILKNIFLSPLKTIRTIFGDGQLTYLVELFAPVGFFSLLAPFQLVFIIPELGIDLLSKNTQLHTIQYHYASIFTPFVYISAISTLQAIRRKLPTLSTSVITTGILIPALLSAYAYGPLPGAYHPNVDMFTVPLMYRQDIDTFLTSIPRKYSVAATNNVGSHLSHRQKIYTIPVGIDQADVIVMLLNDEFAQPSLAAQVALAQKLSKDPHYQKVFQQNDFVVFVKKGIVLEKMPSHQTGWETLFPLFRHS